MIFHVVIQDAENAMLWASGPRNEVQMLSAYINGLNAPTVPPPELRIAPQEAEAPVEDKTPPPIQETQDAGDRTGQPTG